MTATEKAWFMVFYFFAMLPLSYLSRRSLWKAICEAAGTTPEDVRKKGAEILRASSSSYGIQTRFEIWLAQNAPNPKRLMRLYRLYQICFVPNVICAFFSLGGLYTHAVDIFLKIGFFLVPMLIIVLWIAGFWYRKHFN